MSKALGPKGYRADSFGLLTPRSPGAHGVKSTAGAHRLSLPGEMKMKKHVTISAALMLAGCVSMGTNYDPNAVAQLQPGMSKEEAIKILGKPNSISSLPDGQTVLGWVHSTGTAFGGGNARGVTLLFDASGKMTRTVYQNQFEVK